MKREELLEREYRKMKTQAAPDLWNRIEKGLKEHPERAAEAAETVAAAGTPDNVIRSTGKKTARVPIRWLYGAGAAAAAVIVILTASPRFLELNLGKSGSAMSGGMEAADLAPTQAMTVPETTAGAAVYDGAAGGIQESAEGADEGAENGAAAYGVQESGSEPGTIAYDQLQLAACRPLTVPENAVTVEKDGELFTEQVLKDTMLLCQVTVMDARFGEDADGRTARILYDVNVDERYYAEEETAGSGGPETGAAQAVIPGMSLTVTSPIIRSGEDTGHSLYQLQPGGVYLLPLTVREDGWEMVFPYAPQIQRTEDGRYLFHSGYQDLAESAVIVRGSQEGNGDDYDGRMVLREDDGFLSDLTALIKEQKGE